ncbi:MAG: putative toxin-antitoxin system toxin component, PIN family [Methylomonas sp.]|nr:putative toxin-antitoxin system toxin component, PIN family [Methylomonas sp.]PPD20769.1 MAG: putative toxin-antitoxin system toxin component, PIN family [Methylomonas sp.]PPD27308.1 MAG: putative toxin-antitoxin system toxin component, PIN family [Methylomonas sp.]PPD39279.1 MAG: putative toxin-antitoxin system toxin component, PIN family [Methylomonas sp.]PPD40723.1 MAG: putative toxin-antitoxin system toxin component, PIN family [Methylomonas sp.]
MPQIFVIDTNVLVAGLLTVDAQSPTARLLDAMLTGRVLFLLSAALLAEYRAVLLRPKLVRLHGLSTNEVDSLLEALVANALWREPAADAAYTAPDSGGDHLWALLFDAADAGLITGDHLLLQQPPANRRVLMPGDAVRMLDLP